MPVFTASVLFSAQQLFASAFAELLARQGSSRYFRFWCDHSFDQCFKARIAMQRIKQWIDVDPANVGAVAFFVTLFEPAQRFVFIVQAKIKQRAQVANDLALLTYLI